MAISIEGYICDTPVTSITNKLSITPMVSSPSDPIDGQTADIKDFAVPAKPKADWATHVDTAQVFRLIDSILPFEACLYHQLLPLSLEGSRLKLGMVNLEDAAALDYVRRILAYMNCSLVPQTLSTEVHHAALSAYLSYTGSQKQPSRSRSGVRAIAEQTGQRLVKESKVAAVEAATALDQNSHPTLLVDSPEDLNALNLEPVKRITPHPIVAPSPRRPPVSKPAPAPIAESRSVPVPEDVPTATSEPAPASVSQTPTRVPRPEAVVPTNHADQSRETLVLDADRVASEPAQASVSGSTPTLAPNAETVVPPNHSAQLRETLVPDADRVAADLLPSIPVPTDALPMLPVEPKHLSSPVAVLATLPPAELLVELLGRLLVDGIGRLYFERQAQQGRILWSQNGVLQSVVEALPLDVVEGVVNELKLLTHLPLIPVEKPKQVEIERLYQKQRLLLRLRVMPGTHGEEATVQVLRGAALKFYQQQQLASLSRDALTIAHDLQHKVNEIRDRTRFYPSLDADQLSLLPALGQIIKSVEQQLEALKALQASDSETQENK